MSYTYLILQDGEVIGINCITVLHASGISFAIPSNVAQEFLEGAIQKLQRLSKDGKFSCNTRNRKKETFYIGISFNTHVKI